MDDPAPQEKDPKSDFNQIDLTQLQGFSFGTQWTEDKSAGGSRGREPRARARDEGGERRGAREPRRDRRAFKKPMREEGSRSPMAPRDAGHPRREGPAGKGRGQHRQAPPPPYESPYFQVTFYPEDTSFATLAKTIRTSCRTIELFEIARTVIGKPDRFVVVLQRKPAAGAEASAKPDPVHLSVPDGLPFESEEAAIAHVLQQHLNRFFDAAEVEIDPPKGNFQVVNRCGVTGALLAPPNYHLYNRIIQQHHASRLPEMNFEAFRNRIESIRDPEVIQQWLEQMKKTTRYTWKIHRSHAKPKQSKEAAPAPQPDAPAEAAPQPEAPSPEAAVVPAAPVADEAVSTATEAAEQPAQVVDAPANEEAGKPAEAAAPVDEETAKPEVYFDSLEEARQHLLTEAREKVVRMVENARLHGRLVESLPAGEIRRTIEGALERQTRFPLETANALRGRLRREGFTIFKKGAKGVSYVCAVKRKFRVPGQVFSDGITGLINFIETHPMIKAGELPQAFLGLTPLPSDGTGSTPPFPPENHETIVRMQGDLHWLVHEGYVTEFIDGSLFTPVPMVPARRKEIEHDGHDRESFPEAATPAEATEEETESHESESSDDEPSVDVAPAPVEPVQPAPVVDVAQSAPVATPDKPSDEAAAVTPPTGDSEATTRG